MPLNLSALLSLIFIRALKLVGAVEMICVMVMSFVIERERSVKHLWPSHRCRENERRRGDRHEGQAVHLRQGRENPGAGWGRGWQVRPGCRASPQLADESMKLRQEEGSGPGSSGTQSPTGNHPGVLTPACGKAG